MPDALRLLIAPGLYLGTVLVCAWAAGRPTRGLAVGVAAVGLALPWLTPPIPLVRSTFALLEFGVLARTLDLVGHAPRPLLGRLWHLAGVVDTRKTRVIPPDLPLAVLGRVVGFGALCLAGLGVAFAASYLEGPAGWALRWTGGMVCVYALVDGGFGAVRIYYSLLGVHVPVLHRDPIVSKTIGEFWGQRWNRVVGGWLAEHCHRPLAARGHGALGVLAAFTVSALLHVHFAWAGGGWRVGALMGSFFLVQGVLVLVERGIGVKRWPDLVARVWTITMMIGTTPIFVEAFLRLFPVPLPG